VKRAAISSVRGVAPAPPDEVRDAGPVDWPPAALPERDPRGGFSAAFDRIRITFQVAR
jgi:hypothetical protein